MATQADLLVIGGGSGGLATAIRAARHGAKVVLFEPHELGGTCVNRGCVPKKAMWYAAELAEAQRTAQTVGFAVQPGALDWPEFVRRREAYVARARDSYGKRLRELKITVVPAYVRFTAPHALVADGVRYSAPHVLIATGSKSRASSLAGADFTIDSDGFFRLRALPPRVGILGGGYIGVELAGVLHALGANVEMFSRSGLLSHFDTDLGHELTTLLAAQGIAHHRACPVRAVSQDAGALWLDCGDHGRHGPYDCVVNATGRVPNTDTMDLATAGVALGAKGEVQTDAFENTNVAGIYAVGDVNGKPELTPVAIAAGRRLADRLFGGKPESRLDYANIPSVVFAHPPVGSVGLSEAAARQQFGDAVTIHRARFTPMQWSLAGREGKFFMKLVCAGNEQRVVGLHGVGPGMDEMLQGFAVAVRMGATYEDFLHTVAIHPTAAEEFVTMG